MYKPSSEPGPKSIRTRSKLSEAGRPFYQNQVQQSSELDTNSIRTRNKSPSEPVRNLPPEPGPNYIRTRKKPPSEPAPTSIRTKRKSPSEPVSDPPQNQVQIAF
ncbi:hypothetical protein AMECASPLE_033574 [Ameca splendens]|uniref:Uncharacterized protein n=1 Tax=Ameca splendens TaxID=208324 RepID=A0ABV0XJT4_9TELE